MLDAIGEGGGQPARRAKLREVLARLDHALGIDVDSGVAEETVDVRVDHAGSDPPTREVTNLDALGRSRGPRAKLAVDDLEVTAQGDSAGQEELVSFDKIRSHCNPFSRGNAQSRAMDKRYLAAVQR